MATHKYALDTNGSVKSLILNDDVQEMERLSNDLPEEVLIEILSRLPVESVGRMKCLNPSWYNLVNRLIKDTTFQTKHLQNSKHSTSLFFSGWHYCHHSRNVNFRECSRNNCPKLLFSRLTMQDNDGNPNARIHYILEKFSPQALPREEYAQAKATVERYHCNGIFCINVDDILSQPRSYILLYNPAIYEFKFLPPSNIDVFHRSGMGFGYDSKSKDYKVVRFGPGKESPTAELYSLATNSWRNIEVANINMSEYNVIPSNFASCEGVLYWVTRRNRYKIMILSFDVSDEVFNVIQVPECFEKNGRGSVKIAAYKESLAVFYAPWMNTQSFDMWVINDFNNGTAKGSCSWNKVATVRHLVSIDRPLGFMNNDEELLMQGKQGELLSYNIRTKRLMNLNIAWERELIYWSTSYVKSMVSVNGGN